MRRLMVAGLLSAVAVSNVHSQDLGPAARLGRIRPLEASTTARGQSPQIPLYPPAYPPTIPPGGTPLVPVPQGQPPMGQPPMGQPPMGLPPGGTPLPPARNLPEPTVVAEPSNGNLMQPMQQPMQQPQQPPAATLVYPQQPSIAVSPPSVYPYTYAPSQGGLLAAPTTVYPGMVSPQLDPPLYAGSYGPTSLLTAPSRWEVSAEYLLWWVRSHEIPSLASTSSPQFSGILGTGDTRSIFGPGTLGNTLHGGARFGAVYWFDETHHWGLDGNLFFLGRNGQEFRTTTLENPLLARPFFNLNQGIPFSEVVGAPNLAFGALAIVNNTDMWGADINFRRAFLCGACSKLDLIMGYKFLRLTDDITITETFQRTGDGSLSGVGVPNALRGTVVDRFDTQNYFHGFNLGVAGEVRRGRWFAEGRATVAFGTVFQTLNINGSQEVLLSTGVARAEGGLLALPGANLGRHQRNVYGVVPEVGVKVGMNLTDRLRLGVGYNFIYLSDVIRAGQQIDTGIDVTRVPNFPVADNPAPLNNARPVPLFRSTDIFAQGISFSLQYRW